MRQGVEDEVMMVNLDTNAVSVDMDTVFTFPPEAEKKLERTLGALPTTAPDRDFECHMLLAPWCTSWPSVVLLH